MRLLILLLSLSVSFSICLSDTVLEEFVEDYYNVYNIHYIVIFACWDNAVEFIRKLMNHDTAVNYQPIMHHMNLTDILRVNYYHVGIVLDFDCPFSGNILEQFSRQLVFNESYHWLIITTSIMIPVKNFENLKLRIDSELTLASRYNNEFKLYDIYNPSYHHGGHVKVTDKGEWTLREGLKDYLKEYKYVRRGNFEGLTLNFSLLFGNTPLPDFHTYLSTRFNIGMDTMTRAHYPLLRHLQEMYNFTAKIHQATTWGYMVNGTFNGLIGDMISGFIDMSITPFEFIEYRYPYVDYTVVTWSATTSFVFIHPLNSNLSNNFFKPFTDETWLMILFVAVIYWLLLLLSLKIELFYDVERKNSIPVPLSETGLTTVAALSAQEMPIKFFLQILFLSLVFIWILIIAIKTKGRMSSEPAFLSGRIGFLSLFLWGLLLFQFYSASIVSSLLTPPPRWIKTIEDLSASDLEAGCLHVMYYHNLFENSKDPAHIELYNRKIKAKQNDSQGNYFPLFEGFRRVRKGGFAFATEIAAIYQIVTDTFSEDEICQLQEIGLVKPLKLSTIVPKHSPFRKMMIYGLQKMVQSGLTKHAERSWRTPRPECPGTHSAKPKAMSIKEFSPALFLLCIGIGISLIILIIENFCYYRKSRLTERRRNTEITD